MHIRPARLIVVSAAVGVGMLGSGANAGAATTVGATTPAAESCGAAAITLLQTSSPGVNYTVPADGVITSWSLRGGPAVPPFAKLKVGLVSGGAIAILAQSAPETPVADTLNTFATRIPVVAGNLVGLFSSNGLSCAVMTTPDFVATYFPGDIGPGPPVSGLTQAGAQVNVSAQLEADADGDGFGDETQDGCPADPLVQGPCPTADTEAPQTEITKDPAKRSFKAVAKYKFKSSEPGSTFECKFDKKPYKACESPRIFGVKKGKHKFRVRATDAAGNVDRSPAKDKFKVLSR